MTSRCLWTLLLVPLALPAPAPACTIPVFRYALERWRPSDYEFLVFHRGKLPQDHLLVVRQVGEEYGIPANRVVTTVDLDDHPDMAHLAVWQRQPPGTKLPWVVLRYPDAADKTPDVWAGPLDRDLLANALYSHARKKVIEHLGDGASAVFVLLEGGDEKADNAAADLLAKELARLEKAVELPRQDPDVSPLESELPLKVSFPVVRLSRKAEDEQTFIRMLLRSEAGLQEVRGPVVLPVFGRGRLLCALHGKDLTADQLGQVARFLCAACSCRVKELNPGIDLLMAADWEKILEQPGPEATSRERARPDEAPLVLEQPDLWTAPVARDSVAAAPPPCPNRWLWVAAGGAAVLVVATGAWALLTLARPQAENPTP
jgi:hypothetical protein